MTRVRREQGAGSLLVLTLAATLAVLASAVAAGTGMVAARHQAAHAADLGALAGASAHQSGLDVCGEVGRIVTANAAELESCRVEGEDVIVLARTPAPSGWVASLSGRDWFLAEARAGPG